MLSSFYKYSKERRDKMLVVHILWPHSDTCAANIEGNTRCTLAQALHFVLQHKVNITSAKTSASVIAASGFSNQLLCSTGSNYNNIKYVISN